MAWLVAFNDGLFDSVEIETIHEVLEKIAHHVKNSQLLLDSRRED